MRKPRPYQKETIKNHKNMLISDQCGMGKTYQGVHIARKSQNSLRLKKPVLILCPKICIPQWEQEIRLEGIEAPIIRLTRTTPPEQLTGNNWIITNSETLLHEPTFKTLNKSFYACIIADESHKYMRNIKSKRFQKLCQLASKRRVCLTATPFDKLPSEMWGMLHWLYPVRFKNKFNFEYKYIEMCKHPYLDVWERIGPKNLDKLYKDLKKIFFARKRDKANMPDIVKTIIPLEMSKEHETIYNSFKESDDLLLDIENKTFIIRNVLAYMTLLQKAASNTSLVDLGSHSIKLEWLERFFEDNPEEPTLVLTKFQDSARIIHTRFGGVLVVGGEQTVIEGEPNLIVGTIGALGTGTNLPHITTTIMVEEDFSFIETSQAQKRFDRLGSTSKTKQLITLLVKGTIDEAVHSALQDKIAIHQLAEKIYNDYCT